MAIHILFPEGRGGSAKEIRRESGPCDGDRSERALERTRSSWGSGVCKYRAGGGCDWGRPEMAVLEFFSEAPEVRRDFVDGALLDSGLVKKGQISREQRQWHDARLASDLRFWQHFVPRYPL